MPLCPRMTVTLNEMCSRIFSALSKKIIFSGIKLCFLVNVKVESAGFVRAVLKCNGKIVDCCVSFIFKSVVCHCFNIKIYILFIDAD